MSKPLKCKLHYVPTWPGWLGRSFVNVCEDCKQIRSIQQTYHNDTECPGWVKPTEKEVKLLSLCNVHDHSYDRNGFFNPKKYGYR